VSENNRSRIVVRIGDAQIELEGEHANVKSLMGEPLFKFIRGFQEVISELPATPAETPEVPEKAAKEFPPQLGKVDTMSAAISTLFKKDWGKKPRSLEEIMNVLEVNGLYYKKSAVATQLVRMMRNKEVRRFGTRGAYKYVVA
jgi:hypothetical protein